MAHFRDDALGFLSRALQEGRLGHAYLISGEEGSGTEEFAHDVAGMFLGDGSLRVEQDPDFHAIGPESKSRRILTEQIRLLEESIHRTPERGSRKVALIRDADRMMPQAANAFLKTLEEPPAGSLLLLTTTLPEALLETIRSRCISVVLRSGTGRILNAREERLAAALARQFGEGSRADATAAFGLCRLFRDLLAQVREEAEERMDQELSAEKARFGKTTEGDWDAREESLKAAAEADVLSERSRLLAVMSGHFAAELRRISEEGGSAPEESRRLLRMLDALEGLRISLERGVQEALALEAGFLELIAVSRQDGVL
jgi:DNA polymerase-3 subunit delta'